MSSRFAHDEAAAAQATAVSAIRELRPEDVPSWDAYVTAHTDGTFFHLAAWADVVRRAFGHRSRYLLAQRGDRIVGVLPLVHLRSRLFTNALISTPFCVYGGVLADDPSIANELYAAASELARDLDVDYLEVRHRSAPEIDWPGKSLYVTFRKQLLPSVDQNLQAIPRKQRAEVRAGIKNSLNVELERDTARFYDIYSQSVRSLGTPVFARRYFDLLQSSFGAACEVATVTHQGRGIASLMTFWFRDEVLPYYGGGLAAARPLSGYDFLYWDLMRRACERGVRIYDFGRSKLETGPFRYKRHWGFEPEPLHYRYYLVRARQVPDISPNNPRYQAMIDLWRRMPLWLTRTLGPLIARDLG